MDKMLELLIQAFNMEYEDIFYYLREASFYKTKIKGAEKIVSTFEEFGRMELRHADILAMKIIALGGKAKLTYKPIESIPNMKDVLKKHIESESKMYRIYAELIEICTDRDFKLVLKGIREDEKDHLEKVTYLYKRTKFR
ncbi:MAG: hypothetical protein A2252_09750 [Elusimicrobia bacterium RIFOXYA2_FULL_39_19]|nr:MAG: hypothetical protein A2252_09750 [Elusimicrobia bacterium RIFOXYA2_FULL_39_19]